MPGSEPAPRPSYLGEDDGFSNEIDYGDFEVPGEDLVASGGLTVTEQRLRSVPGGFVLESVVTFVPENAAKPVAGALILLTLGLHALRLRRLDDL